jgi:chitin disaccharide deacetylase
MKTANSTRYLMVNADDFGLSTGVNRGIIRACEQGMVTSASLMVRWPAATEAAVYARSHSQLSIGLHIDLCEWVYVDETWRAAYEVVSLDNAELVAAEVARQLEAFRRLTGANPTHLDSHQHVHRSEPVHSVVLRLARELGVPLRGHDPEVRYCGDFYGQSNKGYPYPEGISLEALLKIIHELPPGYTELGCHPGDDPELNSTYRDERAAECRILCDPRIRTALATEQIVLCSFSDRAALKAN